MNYISQAQKELTTYPALQRSLKNLERRKERLLSLCGPQGVYAVDTTRPSVQSGANKETVSNLDELCEIERCINKTKARIDGIDEAMRGLTIEDNNILCVRFFDYESPDKMADALGYAGCDTVYKKSKKALQNFAIEYYGAAAIKQPV